eukprot:790291_1
MDLTLWRFVEHEVRRNFVNMKCFTLPLRPISIDFIMAPSTFVLYQTKHDCALSNKARDGGDNVMNEESERLTCDICHFLLLLTAIPVGGSFSYYLYLIGI